MNRLFSILMLIFLSISAWSQKLEMIEICYSEESVIYERDQNDPEVFIYNRLETCESLFLEEFESLYETLEPSDSITCRIFSIIVIPHWKDSLTTDSIFLGEEFGIRYNGEPMKDNEKFLNLIKHKIGWKNSYTPFLYVVPIEE